MGRQANFGEKVGQAYTVNAGYTFGPATVRASWSQFKESNDLANQNQKFNVWGLSGLYAASSTIDLSAGYYRVVDKGTFVNPNRDDANIFGLQADYKLSKRTTLYAAYARSSDAAIVGAQHSGGHDTHSVMNSAPVATTADGAKADSQNIIGVGIRHTF